MSVYLTVYNSSVKIETNDAILIFHINRFLEQYYTLTVLGSGNVNNKPPDKIFASVIKKQPVFFLHRTQFVHLYHYLKDKNIKLEITEKIDNSDYSVRSADLIVRPNWFLKPNQVPVSEFLLNNPVKSKLVPLSTGSGKTFISLFVLAQFKQRIGIVVLPTYIPKWISDINAIHESERSDIMVVSGSDAGMSGKKLIKSLVQAAEEDRLDKDYFIFSNRMLQNFISDYEEDPEMCVLEYGCAPIELFPILGIGNLLLDEVHQHFHSIFKILIHTNVKYTIGLSATLMSEDPVLKRVHRVIFPSASIYGDMMIKKYIDVYPTSYSLPENIKRFIKTSFYGSTNYSHVAFEQSILKRTDLVKSYYRLINSCVVDYYINDYLPKDKCLIFVATVQLATQLTDVLSKVYPDKDVRRYCEDDPYENLMDSDITVSTVLSSGTALDIPNLRVVVQTVSISAPVANIQNLGRLRQLPDRDVKFCYLYSDDITKQKQYHLARVNLFTNRVANIVYRRARVNF